MRRLNNFPEKVREVTNGEYEVLSEYVNCKTQVNMKHHICGEIYPVTPDRFNAGNRCPICNNRNKSIKSRMGEEKFKERLNEALGPEYQLVSKFIDVHSKVTIYHTACKTEYEVKAGHLIYDKNKCPECNKRLSVSKGELLIKEWLEKNDFKFRHQYYVKGFYYKPKSKVPLSFDFLTTDINGNKVFIEFDGEFHFKNWHSERSKKYENRLVHQIRRDKMKDKLCIKNNIRLLRIHYKDINSISSFLQENLCSSTTIETTKQLIVKSVSYR